MFAHPLDISNKSFVDVPKGVEIVRERHIARSLPHIMLPMVIPDRKQAGILAACR
jgi:hypothetical protein